MANKTQKVYNFTFCISCMSKLFYSNFLLESQKWLGFLKNLYGMIKSSKPLDHGISNFSFQILLDLTLEFLDSIYISLVFLTIRHSQLENVLYETRINIIESFENFNTQTTIAGTIYDAFS